MTLGLPSLGSIIKRVRLPKGIRSESEFMDVWLSPYLPRWDFTPMHFDGPFRLIHASSDDQVHGFDVDGDWRKLVALMARLHMPAPDEQCTLLDANCQILLGWKWAPDTPQRSAYAWAGCEMCFDELAKHHDMGEVAMWCHRAREARELLASGLAVETDNDR
jgi:hypothetical protein